LLPAVYAPAATAPVATLAMDVATLAQSVGESPYVLRFCPRSTRPRLRRPRLRACGWLTTLKHHAAFGKI
ncbi:MAG: hypothetical protein ACYC4U_33840, partial [Pirellulaceae bacterium]